MITPTEVPDNPAELKPIVAKTSKAGYINMVSRLGRADLGVAS
ncbi:MAG TPA: hypothetical protein VK283_06650 [Acidimicrobiales bacterium]|nr:hypothetical protein [Acidimicrobiales bacterium]